MGRPPGGLAGCICTVSGHDFSGAEKQDRVWALAPGRALRQLHRLQWLKPSFFYELSARLKPCPDTIHRLEREKSGLRSSQKFARAAKDRRCCNTKTHPFPSASEPEQSSRRIRFPSSPPPAVP